MQLLPMVSPEDYRARVRAFLEAAEYLELTPADRHLAWREHTADRDFHEWPLPAEVMLTDPYYVGPEVTVRPKIKEFIADFADPAQVLELFAFVAGIGSGKSFTAGKLILWTLYQLSTLRRPQHYLSKFPGVQISGNSEILVFNASAAGAEQAAKVVYGDTFEDIMQSPYFIQRFQPYPERSSELLFPQRIRFTPGTSRARSALGLNIFAFAVDEAAFGQQNEKTATDQVRELFDALNKRRRSRFGRLGWGGLFTSPQSEGAYVEMIAKESGSRGSGVMVRRIFTWEAKEELVPGARVFLLDRDPERPRIVEEDLVYVAPGLAQRANGELVRFGPQAPGPRQAEALTRERARARALFGTREDPPAAEVV